MGSVLEAAKRRLLPLVLALAMITPATASALEFYYTPDHYKTFVPLK